MTSALVLEAARWRARSSTRHLSPELSEMDLAHASANHFSRSLGEILSVPTGRCSPASVRIASAISSSATRPTTRFQRRRAQRFTSATPSGSSQSANVRSISTRSSDTTMSRRSGTAPSSASSTRPLVRWAARAAERLGAAGSTGAPAERRAGRRKSHLAQRCTALAGRSVPRRARPERPGHPRAARSQLGRARAHRGRRSGCHEWRSRARIARSRPARFLRLFTDEDVTPRELLDVSERAIAVFESIGDELGLARAWRLAGQAHYLDRRGAACAEATEEALVHARRAQDRFEEREIVEWLVIALLLGPAPARDAFARCLELLEEDWDDLLLPAEVSGAAAALAAMQGLDADSRGAHRASSNCHEQGWRVDLDRVLLVRVHSHLAARSGRRGDRAPTGIRRPQADR